MRLAAGWAGTRLRDNVNGTDLFPCICAEAARQGVPIALLGARPGVAERCAAAITRRFPSLKVVWVHHGYLADCDVPSMLSSLADSGARLLFVAMGVPAQELWLARHREAIAPPVTLAVGALFDFYSGDIPRAPLAFRRLGLEWLFRLALEPRRLFGRYMLGNPRFVARAMWLAVRGQLRQAPLGRDL
jgi:N-acetylglucosaminyldiphosphoundecaprenol N-acetyl-beta-D-mannosaminyltransferase